MPDPLFQMSPLCLCLFVSPLRGGYPRTAPNGQPDRVKAGKRLIRPILGGWVRNLFPPRDDRAIAETRTPYIFRGYRVAKTKNP